MPKITIHSIFLSLNVPLSVPHAVPDGPALTGASAVAAGPARATPDRVRAVRWSRARSSHAIVWLFIVT